MFENLVFKNLLLDHSKKATRAIGVLTSRTALKIYCKSFSKYLAIENVMDLLRQS